MLSRALATYVDSVMADWTYNPTTVGGNVFAEYRDVKAPDVCLLVRVSGANPQLTKQPSDLPTVQLIVRNAPRNTSDAAARALYGALTCLDMTVLDEGGANEVLVITCTAAQSGPIPMGRDSNERCEWSINIQLRTRAISAHRP